MTYIPGNQIAHDSPDGGPPLKIGGKAIAGVSTTTLVAAADRTDLYAGLDGVLIVRQNSGLEDVVRGYVDITATASPGTTVIAASGSGIKTYLTSIIVANATVNNLRVFIVDNTGTPAIKAVIPCPASGGALVNFNVPLPGTANTAWTVYLSATGTVSVTLIGFKSKV